MKEAKNGNTPTLFSPPFYTSRHGYRLAASLCLNGDGKGKGTHISAFISILKGWFYYSLNYIICTQYRSSKYIFLPIEILFFILNIYQSTLYFLTNVKLQSLKL